MPKFEVAEPLVSSGFVHVGGSRSNCTGRVNDTSRSVAFVADISTHCKNDRGSHISDSDFPTFQEDASQPYSFLKLIELVLQESRAAHIGLNRFFQLSVQSRSRTVHEVRPNLDFSLVPYPCGDGQGLPNFRPHDAGGDAF